MSNYLLAQTLKKSEAQINAQNEKFQEGKSTFYEQLNKYSDVPREQFKKVLISPTFDEQPFVQKLYLKHSCTYNLRL